MSVQVRRRREAASFLATFVGAQGELIVDTTNNRVQVHDGATPGGFPAAKLADVAQRTAVADAAYTALAADRTIAFTALTAARAVQLPAASAYPVGTQLLVVDESGACSATSTITLNRAGTDTINGAASATIALPYGFVALNSNGAGKWTVVDQATASMAQQAASNVAITGGSATGLANLSATTVASIGSTQFNRYAAFDNYGRATFNYYDNSLSTALTLKNGGITASNLGASFADVYFGSSAANIAISGRIALFTIADYSTAANRSCFWQIQAEAAGTMYACFSFDPTNGNKSSFNLAPTVDNARSLGTSALRWSTVYAATGPINTSDARDKTAVAPLDDRELAAAKALGAELGTFRFLAAVQAKGDGARTHIGMTVQRAVAVMRAHGLDPDRFGFICHDRWEAVAAVPDRPATDAVAPTYEAVRDAGGEPTGERVMTDPGAPAAPATPGIAGHDAGERFGFRTDELLLFIARGFDARLAALEAR